MGEISEQQLERIDALFVQNAKSFSSRDDAVTLHGISRSTVYFADRPRREVGHLSSRRFVDLWDEGEESFAIDPPNAVLSFLDEDGAPPADTVVVLRDPHLDGDALTYAVEVVDGTLPEKSGPCSLFIDAFGRPLSPVSTAGIRRRGRRRVRGKAS